MTLLAVSIAPDSPEDVEPCVERARLSIADGAELVEWRIDALAEEPDARELVRRLIDGVTVASIITCRPIWEGGEYDGDDDDRVSLFEAIGTSTLPPRYLDVELALWKRSANLRQKLRLAIDHADQRRDVTTRLILSSHDFHERPSDLSRRLAAMADEDACAVVKIAWRARSLRDNLEAFELLRARQKPMIALCMGPFGLPSRVLAKKFGALLTFASAEGAPPTAPGQPTIRQLRRTYRWDSIGPHTRLHGLVGWPVAHSRGPLLHNAGFDAINHDGVYLPLPVPPEWEHFTATVGALVDDRAVDFAGASVTLPHKEHLIRFVRERNGTIDPAAAAIGAANTLVVGADGTLACFNDDAPAVIETLEAEAGLTSAQLRGLRVAIVGAGGVARAVAWALANHGARVVIFNRTPERAESLAESLAGTVSPRGSVTSGRLDALACGCFPLVVNCTPIGMEGGDAPQESPLPDDFPFEPGLIVFDTVAVPTLTPLLRDARAGGAVAIGGEGMFLRQAAAQFRRWTGVAPPSEWSDVLRSPNERDG